MERKIGEQFDFGVVTLEVVESGACKGCFFFNGTIHCDGYNNEIAGPCGPFNRVGGKSVMFKNV